MQTIDDPSGKLETHDKFLKRYIDLAPLPLAIERTYECEILSRKEWPRPCLDVGSGDGIFAHILFKEPIDVGVDINPIELERSKQLGMYKNLICTSASSIPFPDGHFKSVLSNSVLEHIPNIEPVLKEICRVTASGGHVYLTLPTNNFDRHTIVQKLLENVSPSLAARFRRFFNNFWNHYHYYGAEEWQRLFEKCGFKVAEQRTYDSALSCHVNNILAFFSIPAVISRKFLRRWFVVPLLRRVYSPLLYALTRPFIYSSAKAAVRSRSTDGLIFFHLQKIE